MWLHESKAFDLIFEILFWSRSGIAPSNQNCISFIENFRDIFSKYFKLTQFGRTKVNQTFPRFKTSENPKSVKFEVPSDIITLSIMVKSVKYKFKRELAMFEEAFRLGRKCLISPPLSTNGTMSSLRHSRFTQYDPFFKGHASVMLTLFCRSALECCKSFFDFARLHMLYWRSRSTLRLLSAVSRVACPWEEKQLQNRAGWIFHLKWIYEFTNKFLMSLKSRNVRKFAEYSEPLSDMSTYRWLKSYCTEQRYIELKMNFTFNSKIVQIIIIHYQMKIDDNN